MSPHPNQLLEDESWENGGGSPPALNYAESLGVTRVLTETWKVGGYTYTSLADAVAQGRRMQPLSAGI